jgi:CAAX prenyl protease-like protein
MAWQPNRAALARIAPFAALMLLLVGLRGGLPLGAVAIDARWWQLAAFGIAACLLAVFRAEYGELVRQTRPNAGEVALAIGAGLLVALAWSRLDAPWMRIAEPAAVFVPLDAQGQLAWPLVALRWLAAVLVLPLVEELFWRSFLMRWMRSARFETVLPQQVGPKAIVLAAFVYTLAHPQWLAAAIAGLAFAALYVRTGRLWVPVIANAVSQGALGAWVVAGGHWSAW